MLPRVILHNSVSVDGRLDWFAGDIGLHYELAGRLGANAILAGSNTLLAALPPQEGDADEPFEPSQRDPHDTRPWLVAVDSRGRLRNLHHLRREPYWRDVIVLCSQATPPAHLAYLEQQKLDHLVLGDEQVDLRAALVALSARYGVQVVRVDSGGILNGALLRAGLVSEVSVVIEPYLVGGESPRSLFVAPDLDAPEGILRLRRTHLEPVGEGAVWLRYELFH